MAIPDDRGILEGAACGTTSDYVSFTGVDGAGHVVFAIDTNRGIDTQATPPYQAEHLYAVLHDEKTGWQPIKGTGRYPNTSAVDYR